MTLNSINNAVLILFALISFTGCSFSNAHIDELADKMYIAKGVSSPEPPRKFKSDGCSCWPDGEWVECCIEHDLIYWRGGPESKRKKADIRLKKCVSKKGHPFISELMYIGTRLGGVSWLPTSFRWGFGWDYPKYGQTE